MRVETYRHRTSTLYIIIASLLIILALLVLSAVYGQGFDKNSSDLIWVLVIGLSLSFLVLVFALVLIRRPDALVISDAGIYIPIAFSGPLEWEKIHRIRRLQTSGLIYGKRDWLIIDPSPGVLAPLRLPTWRKLELKLQKWHGVRIPLHGLQANPDDVVRSVEHYRPVICSN